MTAAVRLRCCVPFCNRTRGQRKCDAEPLHEDQEWICGKHWVSVPKKARRVYSRVWRKLDREIAREPLYREWWRLPKGDPRMVAKALWERQARIWRRFKAIAIERAMGIG